ncbi:MAG: hypothetical protein AAB723_00920 [Patescibacteria group bacterium]
MDEPKPDIKQIIEKIIQAKFLNQAEQKVLGDLFAQEGVSEAFFQPAQEIFAIAIKREAQKGQAIMDDFTEQTMAIEQDMQQQRASHLAELANKLTQVPEDDFAQKGKMLKEHSQLALNQYGVLEQKIKDLAAQILSGQIKSDQ